MLEVFDITMQVLTFYLRMHRQYKPNSLDQTFVLCWGLFLTFPGPSSIRNDTLMAREAMADSLKFAFNFLLHFPKACIIPLLLVYFLNSVHDQVMPMGIYLKLLSRGRRKK